MVPQEDSDELVAAEVLERRPVRHRLVDRHAQEDDFEEKGEQPRQSKPQYPSFPLKAN